MKRPLYLALMIFALFTGSFHFSYAAIDYSQSQATSTVQTASLSTANWYLSLGLLPLTAQGKAPNQLVLRLFDNETDLVNIGLICSNSPNTLTGGCSGAWAGSAVVQLAPVTGVDLPAASGLLTLASSTMPTYEDGKYYFLTMGRVGVGYTGQVNFIGTSAASSTCVAGCVQNTGQPYFVLSSGSSTIDWTQANIATPIDWSDIVFVSTTTGLFSGTSSQSALDFIADRCEDPNNNLFSRGLCYAGVYLFIPDPGILNNYAQLPTLMQTKFPFSWVAQVKEAITARTAGVSGQMTAFSFNLANLGIGSSTPIGNVLPNYVGFSSTTVTQYIGLSTWNAGQALIAAALWLALGLDIYYTVRRRHAHV